MTKKKLKFLNKFVPLIQSGEKTCSFRKETDISPGECFDLVDEQGDVISAAQCVQVNEGSVAVGHYSVSHKATDEIKTPLWKLEGFESQYDFSQAIKEIYGLPVNGVFVIWRLINSKTKCSIEFVEHEKSY